MAQQGVLLVEGADDFHVLSALFQIHRIPNRFQIHKADGIDRLLESIPVRIKSSVVERFAVVVDADEDLQQRWNQVRGQLIASGCREVPDFPIRSGTVLQVPDGPLVGAWLMPDNLIPGALESFLSFLVPDRDLLLPRVDAFLKDIPEEIRLTPPSRQPKSRIHSWLALQEEPGKPLGQAITAKYLDARTEIVQPFLDWIRKMFID